MLRKILYILLMVALVVLLLAYLLVRPVPLPTEITDGQAPTAAAPAPTPQPLLAGYPEKPPFEGLLYGFILPVLIIGVPWIILQLLIIRYVQPKSFNLSTVRIKAQDGLFVEATLSMTARRTLTLASLRMTWDRVREVVEKATEQELIHEAINYRTLEELERNLKNITEKFLDLPLIAELEHDFGLDVLRFNVEINYPQETMDALNRRAEAAAGGTAYLAYAAAAGLDPNTPECRELYKIFQETSGQVDAARNLGGGIGSLAGALGQRIKAGHEESSES